jgi:hypothetical protein
MFMERMSRETPAPFCAGLTGKFRGSTHHKLHWVLDITFGDDQSRIRKCNAPINMAIVKKTVLNLLSIVKRASPRRSLKRMRKMDGWDNLFLEKYWQLNFNEAALIFFSLLLEG